jgi:hypothetical protein
VTGVETGEDAVAGGSSRHPSPAAIRVTPAQQSGGEDEVDCPHRSSRRRATAEAERRAGSGRDEGAGDTDDEGHDADTVGGSSGW